MINLRQLLTEHPDNIRYFGTDYYYGSSQVVGVFSVFKDKLTHKWISAVIEDRLSKQEVKTNDKDINRLLKKEDLSFISDEDYAIHPNLLQSFVNLHRLAPTESAYEYRNSRPDIPINGRVWSIYNHKTGQQTTLVSFWSNREKYMQFQEETDTCLRLLHQDPKKCMYEFINQPNEWMTYEEVLHPEEKDAPLSASEEEFIKRLMKIQHTNPEAKKALKQIVPINPNKLQKQADELGITVVALKQAMGLYEQEKLTESPDSIFVNNNWVSYCDDFAQAVICIGYFVLGGSGMKKKGWLALDRNKDIILMDKKIISRGMSAGIDTHAVLLDAFLELNEGNDYERILHARLFKVDGIYYLPFWEEQDECKKFFSVIVDCVNYLTKGKVRKTLFQFEEQNDNEFISFSQAFSSQLKRTKSEVESELQRKLHLMDPKQKAEFLKKLGATKPNKLQAAADKLGITTIELKQALGMDVAENSLGNLSFSDYHDPSIPYEAKPRINIGFDYGTVFEKYSKKHKKL